MQFLQVIAVVIRVIHVCSQPSERQQFLGRKSICYDFFVHVEIIPNVVYDCISIKLQVSCPRSDFVDLFVVCRWVLVRMPTIVDLSNGVLPGSFS